MYDLRASNSYLLTQVKDLAAPSEKILVWETKQNSTAPSIFRSILIFRVGSLQKNKKSSRHAFALSIRVSGIMYQSTPSLTTPLPPVTPGNSHILSCPWGWVFSRLSCLRVCCGGASDQNKNWITLKKAQFLHCYLNK